MQRRPLLIGLLALVLAASLVGARPAAAQAPAPDQLAAAKELVAASRASDQLRTLMPLIMRQLKPAIAQGRPDVERDFDAALPSLLDGINARTDDFTDAIALIYARNFTIDELHEIASFYRSPIGQTFLQKMPVIAQESMAMGQRFGQEIAAEARRRMIHELHKRGHNDL
jgi:hypothetical protein